MDIRASLAKTIPSNPLDWQTIHLRLLYEAAVPRLDTFRRSLEANIRLHLDGFEDCIAHIESRTKSFESLLLKKHRPDRRHKNPFCDFQDLVGVRIITYFWEDRKRITEHIRQQLKEQYSFSPVEDKGKSPENEFTGYTSIHFTASMNPTRVSNEATDRSDPLFQHAFETSDAHPFVGEIQVRTILEHAWASIEHGLGYKTEVDLTSSMKKELRANKTHLIDFISKEFSKVRKQKYALQDNIRRHIRENEF